MRYFVPSISLLAIVIDAAFRVFTPAERRAFLTALALAALILYASVLGFLPDVYRIGFLAVPITIAAFVGIAIAERSLAIGAVALCGLVAFDLHLLPTRNLIDYFIDPAAALIAIAWGASQLLRQASRAIRKRQNRTFIA